MLSQYCNMSEFNTYISEVYVVYELIPWRNQGTGYTRA
jgi:hypothetical protein